MGFDVKDSKNLADAKKFAYIYTFITTLIVILLCTLSMGLISSIPIIGGFIGSTKILSDIIFAIIHIVIAVLIDSYFSLYSRLGYGYYALRKGVGPHASRPLDRNFGARLGLFFLHSLIVSVVTSLLAGFLHCMFLGTLSVIFNVLMMLLQRIIYTPRRAMHLR